ncbi:chemotaxis protein CheA [Sedimentibacter sp. zth1]|uniref:chemotaxis protein CheA n=1 Tax=Sedimentibacter sp. zth1 TaxID=2816908 RepID=UPI001A91BDFC|nr:chemotaxis protein CheA [Sedimentibacter sp. zth1]QSX07171.1 chemotaxis protein CheA [Sedimentibacter sp. zth1]
MENNFDSVVEMFLYEANTLLEQLDEILLRVEEQQEFSTDYINEIFRIMHTIKGSAAMMQYNSIMTISHKIEDLFYYIRENGALSSNHNEDLINLVFKCTDFIKGEISKIQDEQPLTENIVGYENEIANLLDVISGKQDNDKKNPSQCSTNNEKLNNNDKKFCIRVDFDDDCGMENLRAFMITNQLKDITTNFTFEPTDVETNKETIKDILQNGFRIFFENEAELNLGINVVKDALNVKNYIVIEQEVQQNTEVSNEVKDNSCANKTNVPTKENKAVKSTTSIKHNKQSLISVNLSKLDQLSNLVGEIVITESMVMSNPEIKNLNLDSFTKATRQLEKLTDDLQNIVMSLRMVPVSGVFQKMKRIVRDMNKSLGKDVELVLVGDDIEVDKNIVDGIADPLMHVVRNSMDHGIESAEERIAKGKNPKGTIILTALNTGGEILITVQDNGKGLNPDYILTKAKSKNLLTKPESEYSQKDILNLIMLPGFSTNESVTEFSGRGVGMDVVKKNIENVNGSVILDSKVDKGTTITFKIPLTLAIVDGMQIGVGDSKFIIPIKNIQQSLNINKNEIIKNTDDSESIMLRNKCYSIVRLHELYNIDTNVKDLESGILVLVEVEDKGYGIFADHLLGEQKVVVKPIPTLLNRFDIKGKGIAGCSILGDGSISLILDVVNIYENVMED